MKLLQKKSKKGITLVESVFAVALLGFAVTGVLTMLLSSGTKIFQIGGESSDYAEATKRMDRIVAAISNYSPDFFDTTTGDLIKTKLDDELGYGNEHGEVDTVYNLDSEISYFAGAEEVPANIRGWYLTIKYQTATVTAFASNSKGAFDNTGGGT